MPTSECYKWQWSDHCLERYRAVGTMTRRVFAVDIEKDLVVKHITDLGNPFYGLSVVQCREPVCRFGKADQLDLPSSWEWDQRSGKYRFNGHRKRHSLSTRSPESISLARAYGFNKPAVAGFFNLSTEVTDRYQFQSAAYTIPMELKWQQGVVAAPAKK